MNLHPFITPEKFVADYLPMIISGKHELTALFTTYREVDGYAEGLVAHHKPGLHILVRNGGFDFPPVMRALLQIGVERREPFLAGYAFRQIASLAQEKLAKIVDLPINSAGLLYVTYAGVSAFEAAVVNAEEIAKRIPSAQVIVVTCDCDPSWKARRLAPAVAGGLIHGTILGSDRSCGGEKTMRYLLEALLNVWPTKPETLSTEMPNSL